METSKKEIKKEIKTDSPIKKGFLVPGLPHLLLCPEKKPEWTELNKAFKKVRDEIEEINPDVILIYSSYWFSILGHQVQAMKEPEWTLVDEEWHELGSIPYKLKMDVDFANTYVECARERGLKARTTAYKGFPIDTGSVVALKLLNPDNKFKASIVSSNVYSDRAETVVLGKAAVEALKKEGKTAVAVVISSLSNRYLDEEIDYSKPERIHSLKDEEWNQKYLEFLSQGRLEDVAQLSRQFHREARVSKKVVAFKPFWWFSTVMGSTNNFKGEVFCYKPVHGTGAAVVGLTPTDKSTGDLEFDEENAEVYKGNRNVLSSDDSSKDGDEVLSEKN